MHLSFCFDALQSIYHVIENVNIKRFQKSRKSKKKYMYPVLILLGIRQ